MPLLVKVLLTAALPATYAPQERAAPEYEIKAAFLYNFAVFVEWPLSAFPDDRSPFVVGVVGRDPFGSILEETFRGKDVGGRRISVQRVSTAKDLGACHLVFVSSSERESMPRILESLKGSPTLTVGEMDGFAARGGCVGFYAEDRKVRFEINLPTVKRAGLKVSSKLLRLARILETQK
jgi:hypothetical protein